MVKHSVVYKDIILLGFNTAADVFLEDSPLSPSGVHKGRAHPEAGHDPHLKPVSHQCISINTDRFKPKSLWESGLRSNM